MLRRARPDAYARQRWLQQLATLLEAGIALHPALLLLARQQPADQQDYWRPVADGVEQGQALSTCLRGLSGFTGSDLALITVAERTGTLARQLSRLAELQARRLQLRAQMLRALRYPALALTGTLAVSAFLLAQVVPGFAELYASFSAELPWLTRQVLAVSDWLQAWGITLLFALLVALAGGILAWRHQPRWRTLLNTALWHAPICGRLVRAYWLANWHRTLHDTLLAGLPLAEALTQAATLVDESPLAAAQARLQLAVQDGRTLSAALNAELVFPPLSGQMVAVGEESGMLAAMLRELARHYEYDLETGCEQSLKLLEPLLMAGLGVLVGVIVMALYLPLFQLGQVI